MHPLNRRRFLSLASAAALSGCASAPGFRGRPSLRAGAAAVDISPPKLPAIVNGGFVEKMASRITDPLHARAIVLDDGATRLAIVVVDSCMVPRDMLDDAKRIAHGSTGIAEDRMLISSTHTHSAPSAMGALGSSADPDYVRWLPAKIAEAIQKAAWNMEPAQAGWAVVPAAGHTHCRRWITRPDKMLVDPFGEKSARAMMHPGYQNPDYLGPAGAVDPDLSLLSIRALSGGGGAVLANYSMHYVGATPVSADYYGRFCVHFADMIKADPRFVAVMSQGTSGDQHWMDYGRPKPSPVPTSDSFARELAAIAKAAYDTIEHRSDISLAMAETKLTLKRRVADEKRLAWAREMVAKLGDKKPTARPDVYAREQLLIAADPVRQLKLQAVRIGDFGITAIPNEVFGITGLKLKLQSPLQPTMNIELANGGEGYIPPPEQHALGGYTTWAARTAALEPGAEPAIVEALLKLLEKVSGRPRKKIVDEAGDYAKAVLASKPAAYWRMSALNYGPTEDVTGHGHHARLEGKAAMFLEGPSGRFGGVKGVNRAVQLCGGAVTADMKLGPAHTIELWACDYLADKTWRHIVMVRDGSGTRTYVDGKPGSTTVAFDVSPRVSIAGGFEGRVDEIAVYDRALSAEEITSHHRAAGAVA